MSYEESRLLIPPKYLILLNLFLWPLVPVESQTNKSSLSIVSLSFIGRQTPIRYLLSPLFQGRKTQSFQSFYVRCGSQACDHFVDDPGILSIFLGLFFLSGEHTTAS